MLKPDLILSYHQLHHYQLLSAIAPTVPHDAYVLYATNQAYFKANLRYIAKLMDRETKAEEVLDRYQQRVEELKKRLGNRLRQLEVSVIYYGEDIIHTISNQSSSPVPAIFNDIGLRYKFLSGVPEIPISIEAIGEYDADVLFIVNVAERPASFYFQHPMFSSLKAVKNNQAYVVNQEIWSSQGILGANKVLDDLFKYLPEG